MADTDVQERVEITIDMGDMWNVIFHNDDKTTMEFVIFALMSIFNKPYQEAIALMFLIHNTGSANVASYSCFDIAEQKAKETMALARDNDYPLVVTVEQ